MYPVLFWENVKISEVYNSNEQRLVELKSEYRNTLDRLDKLEQEGTIGTFDRRTIIELSINVIKEIAQKYEDVQKGVGDTMGGVLIETEARTSLNHTKKLLADDIEKFMKKLQIELTAKAGMPIRVSFRGDLKTQQGLAAQRLLAFDHGILNAAAAFGKTVVCSTLLRRGK